MRARVFHLGLFFGAGFALVGGRLFQLQILKADSYRELADRARSWDELTPSCRGRIVDRKGRTLACDVPSFNLSVVPARLGLSLREGWKEELRRLDFLRELAHALGVGHETLASGMEAAVERAIRWGETSRPHVFFRGVEKPTWLSVRILSDPSYEEVLLGSLSKRARGRKKRELSSRSRFPGIACTTSLRRRYPRGRTACHVVGYLQLCDESEVDALRKHGLLLRSFPSRGRLAGTLERSPEARRLAESVLEPGEALTAHLLASRVRSLPEEKKEAFAEAFGRWLASAPAVELTEGEKIWVESRRHLKDMRIGRRGVEAVENQSLRGKHGFRVLMLQPGKRIDYLREEPPRPGSTVALTLDVKLQRAMEQALERAGSGTMGAGAGVAMDVRTGECLVLASSPGFDPNWFVTPGSDEVPRVLSDRARRPMFDRAIQGLYPLGSVFKVVVAAGALAQGTVSPEMRCGCSGVIERGRGRFRCGGVHGETAIRRAIVVSCNVFFYLAGESLGAPALASWAREFGFGARTGLELPGEKEGTVPDPSWKEEFVGGKWLSPAETYHFAIGQGYLCVTPLQVACMMCAFANGGRFPRPRVLQRTPEGWRRLPLSPEVLALVREGMRGAVNDPDGTAYGAFHGEGSFGDRFPAVAVAGKTGSAQHSSRSPTHSWFAGYAPADSPELAFAVIIERGGRGGGPAAEAAAQFLTAYFEERGR